MATIQDTEYEIFALKYAGPFVSSGAMLLWLREWETTASRYYYFWSIMGGDEPIIVDCGVPPELAKRKNLPGYTSPEAVLARVGIVAEQVKNVILTHLHWDHASGAHLFPNARFFLQQNEFQFWLNDPLAKRPPLARFQDETSKRYIAALSGTDRLRLIHGDEEIFPGIEVILVPGHSPGLQAVSVKTAKGTAIIGSDSASIARSYKEDWPSCITIDLPSTLKSYDKLRERATSVDLIFPGHDRQMLEIYPEVAEDITKLA